MSGLGFVVIEVRPTLHQPRLLDLPTLHPDYASADRERWDLTSEAIGLGCRETYRVARLELVEEEE